MRRHRDETAKLFRTTTSTAGEATPRPTTWALPMALAGPQTVSHTPARQSWQSHALWAGFPTLAGLVLVVRSYAAISPILRHGGPSRS